MNDVVVVHYSEIALKLGHRSMFVGRLLDNVREVLRDLPCVGIAASDARILVETGEASAETIVTRLSAVPGVANCLVMQRHDSDMNALETALKAALEHWSPTGSFAVRAQRADKSFPLASPEIGARLGEIVIERTGARVDLKHPDCVVYVLILGSGAYLGFNRVPCSGGLPVGTGGRVLLLLSGGIDSPVAGARMMRRGCRLEGVHFHSVPYLSAASQEKARELAAVLARGQGRFRVSMVAFGDIQSQIVGVVPRPLRVVLYRRMMMRIASRLARRGKGAAALVTGESLGQVASQTLTNMAVIEEAASIPVLRPLVGMDKLEISRFADSIGTFEISIQPDQDCCTLFVPKHPATAARMDAVLEAEALFPVTEMTEAAAAAAVSESIAPDWPADGEVRRPLV
jgi:thiamine biosynthesis protein ThiI